MLLFAVKLPGEQNSRFHQTAADMEQNVVNNPACFVSIAQ